MASGARRKAEKENFWRRMIRGQALDIECQGQVGSGRSIRAWCGRHAVTEAAFYWWRRQLARRDTERRGADQQAADPRGADQRGADRRKPAFVPVRLTEDSPAKAEAEIETVPAPERRVRRRGRVDRQALADVLAVLAEESSRGHAAGGHRLDQHQAPPALRQAGLK